MYSPYRYPFGIFCDSLCFKESCPDCRTTPLSSRLCDFWTGDKVCTQGVGSDAPYFTYLDRETCARQGRMLHELSAAGAHWRRVWAIAALDWMFAPWFDPPTGGYATPERIQEWNERAATLRVRGLSLFEAVRDAEDVATRSRMRPGEGIYGLGEACSR
jgi:hypothetical protein